MVSIPGKVVDTSSDLKAPTVDLLTGLHLLGDDDKAIGTTVLESNATNISKWVGTIVAGLGGASAVLAGVGGFMNSQPNAVRISLIAAMGFTVSVAVASLAWIVGVDLRVRLQAQRATYQARKEIALAILDDSFTASPYDGKVTAATAPGPADAQPAAPTPTPGPTMAVTALISLLASRGQLPVVLPSQVKGLATRLRQHEGRIEVEVKDNNGSTHWYPAGQLTLDGAVDLAPEPTSIPQQSGTPADQPVGAAQTES